MIYPDTMPPIPPTSDLSLAFGATEHLPRGEDVPEHLRWRSKHPATEAVETMFYGGWAAVHKGFVLRPRYDDMTQEQGDAAVLLIAAHLRSWVPKHEDKIAGCATLMDRYFKVDRR